ncbi:MAG: SEL1-like repeat protein [Deltaproteobacteria bacterium]|nr:SEL1-like repeat protein [Deltaproteobacteria bacterium]
MIAPRRTIPALVLTLFASPWSCDSGEPSPVQATPPSPPPTSAPIDLDESEAKVIVDAQKCDAKDAAACHRVGVAFRDGRGIDRDLAKARELFAQACEMGDQPACESARSLDPSPPRALPEGGSRPPGGPAAPGRRAP